MCACLVILFYSKINIIAEDRVDPRMRYYSCPIAACWQFFACCKSCAGHNILNIVCFHLIARRVKLPYPDVVPGYVVCSACRFCPCEYSIAVRRTRLYCECCRSAYWIEFVYLYFFTRFMRTVFSSQLEIIARVVPKYTVRCSIPEEVKTDIKTSDR